MSEKMSMAAVMGGMTLRQMEAADELWREHIGPDGPKLQEALSATNYRAMAAMVAAKMRMNGHPAMTIDEAMDIEIDVGTDTGEANGGNAGDKPALSPEPGL